MEPKLPDQQRLSCQYSTLFSFAFFAFISASFFFLKVHFEFANSFAIFDNVSVFSSIFLFFWLLIFLPFFVPYFFIMRAVNVPQETPPRHAHTAPSSASRAPAVPLCLSVALFWFVLFRLVSSVPPTFFRLPICRLLLLPLLLLLFRVLVFCHFGRIS